MRHRPDGLLHSTAASTLTVIFALALGLHTTTTQDIDQWLVEPNAIESLELHDLDRVDHLTHSLRTDATAECNAGLTALWTYWIRRAQQIHLRIGTHNETQQGLRCILPPDPLPEASAKYGVLRLYIDDPDPLQTPQQLESNLQGQRRALENIIQAGFTRREVWVQPVVNGDPVHPHTHHARCWDGHMVWIESVVRVYGNWATHVYVVVPTNPTIPWRLKHLKTVTELWWPVQQTKKGHQERLVWVQANAPKDVLCGDEDTQRTEYARLCDQIRGDIVRITTEPQK